MKESCILVGVCLAGFCAAALLGYGVLQHFPNSGDEWCYLLQAEIFSQGRLSVPSPPQREFFEVGWMINNGRFYTQHPPGWPLVLAPGVLVGAPWLVNPLLGGLTLLVLCLLGKHMYGDIRVGGMAALLTLMSPFFLFNSASYWAHPSSLLALSLSLLGFVRGLPPLACRPLGRDVHGASPAPSAAARSAVRAAPAPAATLAKPWRYTVLGGLCGSLSLLIRPLDQLALLGACGLFCLLPSVRRRHGFTAGVVFVGSHLVGVLLLLVYHTLQHGHPLVSGYHMAYGASGASNIQWNFPTWHYIDDYGVALLLWTAPGLPLVAGGYGLSRLYRRRQSTGQPPWDGLLSLVCLCGIVVYALVAYPSLVGYGPRYYYSLVGVMALLAARGSFHLAKDLTLWLSQRSQQRLAVMLTCLFLVALGVMYTAHLTHETAQLKARMAFQRLVERRDIHHAVVFIRGSSGDFEANDLTRNRLDFQGDVVFALDRGGQNSLLMEHYPGRRYFLYTADQSQGRDALQELFPPPRPRAGH